MWKTRLHILSRNFKHRDHSSASAGKQTFSCAALYPQRVVSALVAHNSELRWSTPKRHHPVPMTAPRRNSATPRLLNTDGAKVACDPDSGHRPQKASQRFWTQAYLAMMFD